MAELVADCPRCGSKRITFDVLADIVIGEQFRWQQWYEAFCICRHCGRSTVFVLHDSVTATKAIAGKKGLSRLEGGLGELVGVKSFISVKDRAPIEPPEHLPENILAAFKEGARCLSVECFTAAGVMFRKCVDLATKEKLPPAGDDGPNERTRRSLGLLLPWLFERGLLPKELKELSTCIKEDGDDAAHAGPLSPAEAEDLLDFTVALLERLYTEPARLREAQARREARRGKT
jgi:hypothetical protein